MSFVGQRPGQFDRAGLPANGALALRAEPRTVVRQPAQLGATPFAENPALGLVEYWASGKMSQNKNKKTAVQDLKTEPIEVNNTTAKGGSV